MTRLILICCAIVFSTYAAAVPAYAQGTTREQFQATLKRAELGNSAAQYNTGLIYYNGQAYAEAAKWYRKAAEQGNSNAQLNLGSMHFNGTGMSRDYAEAAKWYRKSAEQGDAIAQWQLGSMFAQGTGMPQDYAEGYLWVSLSAAQGYERAQSYKPALARLMTNFGIVPAKINASNCRNKNYKNCY